MVDGMYALMLAGMPATELGVHSPVEWETSADGGCGEASWTFALPPDFHHPALMRDVAAELRWGSFPVWSGKLLSYDRDTGQAIGAGHSRKAYELLALDGAGNSTRDVAVAIAQAITRGWPVVNHNAATGVVAGDSTEPITVGALLDQRASELGMRWGVTARGAIYMRADPTGGFRYQTVPASAVLSPTAGEWPTHLVGVYSDGTNNLKTIRPALATVDGRRLEEPIDLTGRGTLTLAEANAILDGILATAPKVGWTQGMTLPGSQLRTIGDMPAALPVVVGGEALRVQGLLGSNGTVQAPYVDVVIGRTRYTAGADEIQIDPVGLEPWNPRDALAAA